jgi:hypothetical protein
LKHNFADSLDLRINKRFVNTQLRCHFIH